MCNDISITGITPLEYYPCKCSKWNCKQNIKSIKVCIPCQKFDIESINDIKVSICVDSYKVIKTILGLKVILNLSCEIKAIYTALNEEQSIHSAHWNVKFCDFSLDENNSWPNACESDLNLFVGLEGAFVCSYDRRSIEMSILYIICNTPKCSTPDYNVQDCNISVCNTQCKPEKPLNCNSYKSEKKLYTPKLSWNKENNYGTYYCPVEIMMPMKNSKI